MISTLHVAGLGVIDDLTLELGPNMTALTGETGAGKTLIVGAIDLAVGGRAAAHQVRTGTERALVEVALGGAGTDAGVAADAGDGCAEHVLAREVAQGGRSKAYLDGRMVPAGELARVADGLIELHGQHGHQSLLHAATQRAALDAYAAIDTSAREAAAAKLAAIDREMGGLGGDPEVLAAEADLLSHQLAEIERAAPKGEGELADLAAEEAMLADAAGTAAVAGTAYGLLAGDDLRPGAADAIGAARKALEGQGMFGELAARSGALEAEARDLAGELRALAEWLRADPERLAAVQERRRMLSDLARRHGGSLAGVAEFAARAADEIQRFAGRAERLATLGAERERAAASLAEAVGEIAALRRAAAPRLAAEVQSTMGDLGLGGATLAVEVGGEGGDAVSFLLAANPGERPQPLEKVASGGELARTMLALRLALSQSPPTLVFDEVDAGIGGEAAIAVGRALAAVARKSQVLVVTHLPQVAAFADHHIRVTKRTGGGRASVEVERLEGGERLTEISRMLAGLTGSETGRLHAAELLAMAGSAHGT